MIFGVESAVDFWIFVKAVGLGYILGAIYYFLRLFQNKCNNRAITAAGDFLFFVSSAFLSFIFVFDVNYGVFRCYIPIGEVMGIIIFFASPAKRLIMLLPIFFLTAKNRIFRKKTRDSDKNDEKM